MQAALALNAAWRALQVARGDEVAAWKAQRYQEAMDLVADAHQAIGIHPLTEEDEVSPYAE